MRRPPIRTVFLLGVVVGVVVALLRALGRTPPSAPAPLAAPAPPLPAAVPRPEPVATAAPVEVVPAAAPAASGTEDTWAPPVDGACPEGFPIKAKEASGIYHRPGGLSYERTKPDRCYPDEATAEADGFRAAKR